MNKTGIEYLDYTWTPMHGCSKISAGCNSCWAFSMAKRLAGMNVKGYSKEDPFRVVCDREKLKEPLLHKKPAVIGVSFMGDLFHDDVPMMFIHQVFLTMMWSKQHRFMILTKRPERLQKFIDQYQNWNVLPWNPDDFSHVWFGVTAENQEQADKRVPVLLSMPVVNRFVSIEPMLEGIDLVNIDYPGGWRSNKKLNSLTGFEHPEEYHHRRGGSMKVMPSLDLVIVGGESGPAGRYCHPAWVRTISDQCRSTETPFMFKQWGQWLPLTQFDQHHAISKRSYENNITLDGETFYPVGKSKSGHFLDGQEHLEIPEGLKVK